MNCFFKIIKLPCRLRFSKTHRRPVDASLRYVWPGLLLLAMNGESKSAAFHSQNARSPTVKPDLNNRIRTQHPKSPSINISEIQHNTFQISCEMPQLTYRLQCSVNYIYYPTNGRPESIYTWIIQTKTNSRTTSRCTILL